MQSHFLFRKLFVAVAIPPQAPTRERSPVALTAVLGRYGVNVGDSENPALQGLISRIQKSVAEQMREAAGIDAEIEVDTADQEADSNSLRALLGLATLGDQRTVLIEALHAFVEQGIIPPRLAEDPLFQETFAEALASFLQETARIGAVDKRESLGDIFLRIRYELLRLGVRQEYVPPKESKIVHLVERIDPNIGAQILGGVVGAVAFGVSYAISTVLGTELNAGAFIGIESVAVGALLSTFLIAYQEYDARKEKLIRAIMASVGSALTICMTLAMPVAAPAAIPVTLISDIAFFAFWKFSGMSRARRAESFTMGNPVEDLLTYLKINLKEAVLADEIMVAAPEMNEAKRGNRVNTLFDELEWVLSHNEIIKIPEKIMQAYFALLEGNTEIKSKPRRRLKNLLTKR